jgi:glycosyltransferase involved in cell wall biosynthesis
MRIVAILATYNEEVFIAACLEHLSRHGIAAYLIDNCSTDRTVAIAEGYLSEGLIGIEMFPRAGVYRWRSLLERKEEVAASIQADWFIHADPDEFFLPPRPDCTLSQALADVDARGFNAVNFSEFTFIPTHEAPDHLHHRFQETMLWYYPFSPTFPHQLKAWKRQPGRVEFAWSGGHLVRFPGLNMAPESFPMRHYQFLSVDHAIQKYVNMRFDSTEVAAGWHGWRAKLRPEMIRLPSQAELRTYRSDDQLDPSNPRRQHYLEEALRLHTL